jgi:NDP-sugar pyrophosphorylase family protein
MNAVLICPSPRPAVEHLSLLTPLAAIPLLGENLVEYWLTHLAMCGHTDVCILADDRPEQIKSIAGNGARWGLKVSVIAESRELTAAQAQIKYVREMTSSASPQDSNPLEIVVLDHFPGSTHSLFTSYADLFAGVIEWLPHARMPDRVGLREIQPGIWVGLHSKISPGAQLNAPCWIGQHVYVAPHCVVGPMAVIEDRAFVEPEASIVSSIVGPDTFVGKCGVIQDAFAWGNTLVNWKTNVCAEVTDAFLLCALRKAGHDRRPESFFGWLSDVYSRNRDDLQMFWKHFLMNREG